MKRHPPPLGQRSVQAGLSGPRDRVNGTRILDLAHFPPWLSRPSGYQRRARRTCAGILTGRLADPLDSWMARVGTEGPAPHRHRCGDQLIRNGLSLSCSSGTIDGNVNHIRMVKRLAGCAIHHEEELAFSDIQ